MYQNQLFFDDFQKVFKVKLAEEKVDIMPAGRNVENHNYHVSFWLRRIVVKFNLQYRLH